MSQVVVVVLDLRSYLGNIIASEIGEVRLHGMGDASSQIGELDGFSAQFPLVPLIRLDEIGFVKVSVSLSPGLRLRDRLFDHLACFPAGEKSERNLIDFYCLQKIQ